jgi:expansin
VTARHASTARRQSLRWLATGGVALLAGVVAVAVLLRTPACAAPPTTSAHHGKATFYDLGDTTGNCSFPPPADDLYVALSREDYSGAAACGGYLDVTGPRGTVRVKVFDTCPECTPGWLDLSRTAFKHIGAEVQGVIPITYRAVPNARVPGPLSITFVDGSSRYWWAILIDNHANPIRTVEARRPGGPWMTASRTDYNYWVIDHDTGSGPYAIRMTDIYGHTATATGIDLVPGERQTTAVTLSGQLAKPAHKKPSPSPSHQATPRRSSTHAAPMPPAPAQAAPRVALAAGRSKTCG